MSSQSKKLRRISHEGNVHSSVEIIVNEKRLSEVQEIASLENMPLEERRKEANKPLYLIRYE